MSCIISFNSCAFVAAVLFGVTWDNTAAQHHDIHVDTGALVGFLIVPTSLAVGVLGAVLCCLGRIQLVYDKSNAIAAAQEDAERYSAVVLQMRGIC